MKFWADLDWCIYRLVFWDRKTTVCNSRPVQCAMLDKKLNFKFQPKRRFKREWISNLLSYFVTGQDTVIIKVNYAKWIRNQDEINNYNASNWLACPCTLSIPLHNVFLNLRMEFAPSSLFQQLYIP